MMEKKCSCGKTFITDPKMRHEPNRRYCDDCREWTHDRWRKKGYIKRYFQNKERKLNVRNTRKVGTGFSEHIRWNHKGKKPDLVAERSAVLKEKRRIGI